MNPEYNVADRNARHTTTYCPELICKMQARQEAARMLLGNKYRGPSPAVEKALMRAIENDTYVAYLQLNPQST